MKKVLAGIAVLAVVASAQAEILATWSANGVSNDPENVGTHVELGALEAIGDAATTSGGIFAVNKLHTGGGVGFTYDVDNGWQITDLKISGSYGGATSGPKQLDWYVDSNPAGASIIREGSTAGTFSNVALNGTLTGDGYIKLLANTAEGNYNGGTLASNGTFNFRTATGFNPDALKLEGTPSETTAVPEPATMSLLGLGALAMVIRRKLSK